MTTFSTSREIPAPVEHVFAAFSHPERLSRWWGPADFTSTFSVCEFKNGGRWSFIMHGPDGRTYPNESGFAESNPVHITCPCCGESCEITVDPSIGKHLARTDQEGYREQVRP